MEEAGAYEKRQAERAAFAEKVRRFEKLSRDNPRAYMRAVRVFALLGYAFIFGLVLVSALLIAGCVLLARFGGAYLLVKVGLFAVLLLLAIGRALLFKISPPEGVSLTEDEAPGLWRVVREVAAALGIRQVHGIILDLRYNASAAQVPMLGVLGPRRNLLTIGLPLMLSNSPDELKGIIAHELGHFGGKHSAFSAWIWRQSAVWHSLQRQFSSGSAANVIAQFVRWYEPRLKAMTVALRRQHEFEADHAATAIGLGTANAHGLMRSSIQSKAFATIWEEIWVSSNKTPSPPDDVVTTITNGLRTGAERFEAEVWLKERLADGASILSSHPPLSQRLEALGFEAPPDFTHLLEELRFPANPSAAEVFLDRSLPGISERLNKWWLERSRDRWRKRFEEHEARTSELVNLEQSADASPVEVIMQRARVVAGEGGYEAAVPYLQQVLEQDPSHAEANYVMGLHLATSKDPSAEEYFERAVAAKPGWRKSASKVLFELFEELQDSERAKSYYDRLAVDTSVDRAKRAAAMKLTRADKLTALKDPLIAERAEQFFRDQPVESVYAFTKVDPEVGEVKVVVLVPKRPKFVWNERKDTATNMEVIRKFARRFPVTYVRFLTLRDKELKSILKAKPEARVWSAGEK